ncbi:protein-glutamate methylesterase/protein-glutamine glutaminase [Anatilimnocola floriformis]|uniref:protein-glutamate methylesterase/protein-glutamine glutaminase n=1 Tax=Anatilimnocola floriformis TaxID=2948575 RepID=UPI0020C3B839|nr:chemotaxis response regulator protein-glutamate methylesterase [Anatilimnocola floriformis]
MDKIIRVLVVDDSPLMRELIRDVLTNERGIEVVGTAASGAEALIKVVELRPDIVTLDIQMPGMDGLQTLAALLAERPIPVIMVSSLTQRAAQITLQALDCGALDYVPKPENPSAAHRPFRDELLHKLRAMAGADVDRVLRIRQARAQQTVRQVARPSAGISNAYQDCCIALGISTGGPPALSELFQSLAPSLPPIVVVQHMPANFTGPFARRLDTISALSIKEAETGDVLRNNQVLIAPGGRHLRLQRQGSEVVAVIEDSDPVSGHRPSIDVMMRDASAAFGSRCLGIIMTGMGYDGAQGCAAIRAAGGYVLGQDQATSDVYGMNRVAAINGDVDRQFALPELPGLIVQNSARLFGRTSLARAK